MLTCILRTGQHLVNIPPENVPIALKVCAHPQPKSTTNNIKQFWWCCELAYILCTAVFKLSICVFLARICVRRSQIITTWIVEGVVTVFTIIYFFVVTFQCTPVTYFWTQYLGAKGNCVRSSVITGISYAHAAVSCWADWTLGILPVFLVWGLSMNPRTKISVAMILALGAL